MNTFISPVVEANIIPEPRKKWYKAENLPVDSVQYVD